MSSWPEPECCTVHKFNESLVCNNCAELRIRNSTIASCRAAADAELQLWIEKCRILEKEREEFWSKADKPDECYISIAEHLRVVDKSLDMLKLILPMAKAYAYKNDVGSNIKYIEIVEQALAKHESKERTA